MNKIIRDYIYYTISLTLIIIGVIVKYFLVDTNLGAHFKKFNHELLSSDIIFICAIMLALIGFIFNAIKKNKKSTLNDSTIIISAILIMPMTLVLAFTPFLETFYPGKVGNNIFASIFMYVTIIGTFAAFAWIILLIKTFIGQSITILTNRAD